MRRTRRVEFNDRTKSEVAHLRAERSNLPSRYNCEHTMRVENLMCNKWHIESSAFSDPDHIEDSASSRSTSNDARNVMWKTRRAEKWSSKVAHVWTELHQEEKARLCAQQMCISVIKHGPSYCVVVRRELRICAQRNHRRVSDSFEQKSSHNQLNK